VIEAEKATYAVKLSQPMQPLPIGKTPKTDTGSARSHVGRGLKYPWDRRTGGTGDRAETII
jgi:hypothetical protein